MLCRILLNLRDCQERADFLERYQTIPRRPDIAEIEALLKELKA